MSPHVTSKITGDNAHSQSGAAHSAATVLAESQIDADLQVVIDAWPSLSESTKQAILALVQSGGD
jgi:hypothetical protein